MTIAEMKSSAGQYDAIAELQRLGTGYTQTNPQLFSQQIEFVVEKHVKADIGRRVK